MKSKIEEKIKNAREATNEMFAALEELNERLSEKIQSKFKRGDYITSSLELDKWIGILKYPLFKGDGGFGHYAGINRIGELRFEDTPFGLPDRAIVNFSTPSEIALLDGKLKESGKRFDKEKLELVDILKEPKFKKGDLVRTPDGYIFEVSEAVTNTMKTEWLYCKNPKMIFFGNYIEESKIEKYEPKHKEPIIGEMAIFWDNAKCNAFVAKYKGISNSMQCCSRNDSLYTNAILFESVDQYKEFLKS